MESVARVRAALRNHQDERVRFMNRTIPVILQYAPTTQQAAAGGCPDCTYYGLWVNSWPGYPKPRDPVQNHGLIFLFESGVRRGFESLDEGVINVLLHEMDHALGNDHVLEDMMNHKAAAMARKRFHGLQ